MKVIAVRLEEELLKQLDNACRVLNETRSAFIRRAILLRLTKLNKGIRRLEAK